MIKRIFDFKESEAKHALIPLVQVEAIEETATVREALERVELLRLVDVDRGDDQAVDARCVEALDPFPNLILSADQQQAIVLCGNATKNGMGGPIAPADITISTAKLNRVLQYEPRDLTISVGTGRCGRSRPGPATRRRRAPRRSRAWP